MVLQAGEILQLLFRTDKISNLPVSWKIERVQLKADSRAISKDFYQTSETCLEITTSKLCVLTISHWCFTDKNTLELKYDFANRCKNGLIVAQLGV